MSLMGGGGFRNLFSFRFHGHACMVACIVHGGVEGNGKRNFRGFTTRCTKEEDVIS